MSYFSIFFVYLYYPMKFERKFLKGPPLLAPPRFEKSGPPLLKKKLDPLPWAFGARPRMIFIRNKYCVYVSDKSGQFQDG